ncbi:Uncharacterised protein g747 [Pycnogonum litorale]
MHNWHCVIILFAVSKVDCNYMKNRNISWKYDGGFKYLNQNKIFKLKSGNRGTLESPLLSNSSAELCLSVNVSSDYFSFAGGINMNILLQEGNKTTLLYESRDEFLRGIIRLNLAIHEHFKIRMEVNSKVDVSISAIHLLDSICPESERMCTFENRRTCGWREEIKGRDHWKLQQGIKQTSPYMIGVDHTLDLPTGWFLSLDLYKTCRSGDHTLISHEITTPSERSCVQLWFFIGNSKTLTFVISIEDRISKTKQKMIEYTGSQGMFWRSVQFSVSTSQYNIYITPGDKNSECKGYVAIDDITVANGECPSPIGKCDFEETLCTWTNSLREKWLQISGEEMSSNSIAPIVDHTTERKNGGYLFLSRQAVDINLGSVVEASLVSIRMDPSYNYACMRFWYVSEGPIGTNRINVYQNDMRSYKILYTSNKTSANWTEGSVRIPRSHGKYFVHIEGRLDSRLDYGIAIDDVTFDQGDCTDLEIVPDTRTTADILPVNGDCDLQKISSCVWTYNGGFKYTPPSLNSKGKLELADSQLTGVLESTVFSNRYNERCLILDVGETSSGYGHIIIQTKVGSKTSVIYDKNTWKGKIAVNLVIYKNFQIRVEVQANDIFSIEKIVLLKTFCLDTETVCTFENQDSCGWTDKDQINFYNSWKILQGKTKGLIADRDHTLGTQEGWFLYWDQNMTPQGNFYKSVIYSKEIDAISATSCVTLWFIMKSTVSNLYFGYETNNKKVIVVKYPKYDGSYWRMEQYEVPCNNFSLFIQTCNDQGTKCVRSLAVDDIRITPGQCPKRDPTCDFEAGYCLWSNTDSVEWTLAIGDEFELLGGPSHDHTRSNDGTGNYVFMSPEQASMFESPIVRHNMTSVRLDPTNKSTCLTFWFMNKGPKDTNYIKVYTETAEDENLLYLSNKTSTNWIKAAVAIPVQKKSYEIKIQGSVDSRFDNGISIDDIAYLLSDCPVQPFKPTATPPTKEVLPDFLISKNIGLQINGNITVTSPIISDKYDERCLMLDLQSTTTIYTKLTVKVIELLKNKSVDQLLYQNTRRSGTKTLSLNIFAGSQFQITLSIQEKRPFANFIIKSIKLTKSLCPESDRHCTFENGDTCGWLYYGSNWRIEDGRTHHSSANAYLNADHTLSTSTGKFLSWKRQSCWSSVREDELFSPYFKMASNESCFQFWFYLGEANNVTMIVYYVDLETQVRYVALEYKKTEGRFWRAERFTVPLKKFSIIVDAYRANDCQGYIAIDDIVISSGRCLDDRANCNFDRGMCTWSNSLPEKWVISKDIQKPILSTKIFDHKVNTKRGQYLLLTPEEVIPTLGSTVQASLVSIRIRSIDTPACLRFWYISEGSIKLNRIKIYMKDNEDYLPLFASHKTDENWTEARVMIPAVHHPFYFIYLEGTLDSRLNYNIYVDDLKFSKDYRDCKQITSTPVLQKTTTVKHHSVSTIDYRKSTFTRNPRKISSTTESDINGKTEEDVTSDILSRVSTVPTVTNSTETTSMRTKLQSLTNYRTSFTSSTFKPSTTVTETKGQSSAVTERSNSISVGTTIKDKVSVSSTTVTDNNEGESGSTTANIGNKRHSTSSYGPNKLSGHNSSHKNAGIIAGTASSVVFAVAFVAVVIAFIHRQRKISNYRALQAELALRNATVQEFENHIYECIDLKTKSLYDASQA